MWQAWSHPSLAKLSLCRAWTVRVGREQSRVCVLQNMDPIWMLSFLIHCKLHPTVLTATTVPSRSSFRIQWGVLKLRIHRHINSRLSYQSMMSVYFRLHHLCQKMINELTLVTTKTVLNLDHCGECGWLTGALDQWNLEVDAPPCGPSDRPLGWDWSHDASKTKHRLFRPSQRWDMGETITWHWRLARSGSPHRCILDQ